MDQGHFLVQVLRYLSRFLRFSQLVELSTFDGLVDLALKVVHRFINVDLSILFQVLREERLDHKFLLLSP